MSNKIKSEQQARNVWLLMLGLTVLTYALGWMGLSGPSVMLLLLATATIKSVFIIQDFMGLRGVAFLWRAIMYGWLALVMLGIVIAYLFGLSA